MPINFHPRAGTVLHCDFDGYVQPEIIKVRPVVVVCTMKRPGLVMVVPLSTTQPEKVENHHHRLSRNPIPGDARASWAKCDMVTTVRFARLDRHKTKKRHYIDLTIGIDDLTAIRRCVAIAARVQLGENRAVSAAPGSLSTDAPIAGSPKM